MKRNRQQVGKPSIRSLAKATGYSVATISRVINNSDLVTEKTREQVLKAIQEVGYIPNSAARALATRRTKIVGALVPVVSQPIFARFIDALEVEFAEHSYTLNIATTHFDADIECKRATQLLEMGAEALIFSGASQSPEIISTLKNRQIPAVCSSIHEAANGLPTIGYNNEVIAYEAVEYLAKLGHKNIAIVHGPENNNDRTHLRLNGVKRAAKVFSLNINYQPAELAIDSGVESAKRLFESQQAPTAIFCLSDILALGVLFEANRQNIKIPKEISLMGCDDLEWSSLCDPTLTTVRLPTKRMGIHIARALVDKLDNHQTIESKLLTAKLIERQSTQVVK